MDVTQKRFKIYCRKVPCHENWRRSVVKNDIVFLGKLEAFFFELTDLSCCNFSHDIACRSNVRQNKIIRRVVISIFSHIWCSAINILHS